MKVKNGFQKVEGHIEKINQWRNGIRSKEFEIARIVALDLIEKFKNNLSRESLSILKLKVTDSDSNAYATPSKQDLNLIEYLSLVCLHQRNSQKYEEGDDFLHKMCVDVPLKHILREIPEDRIGLHVIDVTKKTDGLIKLDMFGKLTDETIYLSGCFNFLK